MSKCSNEELIKELQLRIAEHSHVREELKSVTKEMKNVSRKLEESEAMKGHFISNITNEIINPFSSILGLSKAILSVDKENWKKVFSMVAMIHTEAFSLDFQLKNIFAAAKIEAGDILPDLSNVDIYSVVTTVINSFKIDAKKKKLIFVQNFQVEASKDKPFYFKTDAEKLRLILSNLLNNAVKFSFDEGEITIDVRKEESNLIISVTDTGAGISEENQTIIYDRFKRIDSGITSTLRGHGLGLSINKGMLDLLDGEINLKSKLGEGSVFTFQIPEPEEDVDHTSYEGDEIFFENKQIF
ncbi:MAG: HAMP domain-containing histidine kinase [Bacteroidales bacterium]|nr:HAMP domain-containing histidine kinase [Bacteroidales bacterium]